ncbi:MAG: twin-arginine translocase TatA/TatE family subunit [Dehalococcoidia bacterium]|nr:twin-arginine translocase TatA/TatE family subunit [Dehalococcoidia bacterium]
MNLFGVGASEAGLILLIALILIGPQNFPQVMRQAGRWYKVARAFSNEVMKDVRAAVDEIEQEVTRETGDLQSVRELTAGLDADLRQVKSEIRSIGDQTSSVARGTEAAPGGLPAPTPAAAPAKGWWENRDPNDPFVRLERERAAAREAALAAREAAPAVASGTPAVAEPSATDAAAAPSEQKPDEAVS